MKKQRVLGEKTAKGNVIGFYSSKPGTKYCEFSNFYAKAPPFNYLIPECARQPGFPEVVKCEFSEKAIMLTKAALMGDLKTFEAIAKARDPKTTKSLGRAVKPWDQKKWSEHFEEVAFEVMRQKFSASKPLRDVLLSTGDAVLAEATRNDCIWGIGLNVGEDGVQDPARWKGRNVLGYSLMRARDVLREEEKGPVAAPSEGRPVIHLDGA